MSIVFDIETLALPEEQLKKIFKPKKTKDLVLPEFDPESVKYGRMKDPDKMAVKLEESRAKHEKENAAKKKKFKEDQDKEYLDFIDKAALSPVTSQVAIVAFCGVESKKTAYESIQDTQEAEMLASFWATCEIRVNKNESIIGVNIFDFDLPYLVQRSWILGVEMPSWLRENRRWHPAFIDLQDVWRCGKRMGGDITSRSNFDWLAKAFGTAGKGDVDGSMFGEMWRNERQKAIEYALDDVKQPAIWCDRMGIL